MLGILAAAADDLLTTYIEYDLHFQIRAYSVVPTTVIAGGLLFNAHSRVLKN